MAAVSDNDIIARLGKLSISAPEVLKHAAVSGGAEWRAELDKAGKTGVPLTKTVSLAPTAARTLDATFPLGARPRTPRTHTRARTR
jgi:prolyl-tRNA synthetase